MSEQKMIIEDGVVAGNAYDKYGTRNPVARAMMNGFLRTLGDLVHGTAARNIHEVGCGEGQLSLRLSRSGLTVRGSDFSKQVIGEARANATKAGAAIPFAVASIYELRPPKDSAELVVCCEVLEHLSDPDRALDVLAELARPHLIVSVPREPVWRLLNMARGKYLAHFGNTPGHLNHWSRHSFLKFLSRRVDVIQCRSPFPWTMVQCKARR